MIPVKGLKSKARLTVPALPIPVPAVPARLQYRVRQSLILSVRLPVLIQVCDKPQIRVRLLGLSCSAGAAPKCRLFHKSLLPATTPVPVPFLVPVPVPVTLTL